MKTLKPLGCSVFLWLHIFSVHAQVTTDTVKLLPELVVERSRLESYAIGYYVHQVDSATQQLASMGTLADMLRKNGFGHFRSYGVGGVTTASFRGTGASHTALHWNGVNLQSPLLGQADLTQAPIFFFDDVQFQVGGTASLYGSGAIGGTIHLNSSAEFDRGLRLTALGSAGSFGTWFNGASVKWSGQKFINHTRLFRQTSQNDFPYENTNVVPAQKERRAHAQFLQRGVLQENHWRVHEHQSISLRLWLQDNDMEVPNPTTVNRVSQAAQREVFYRTQASWQLRRNSFHARYQASFIHHDLRYQDDATQLNSSSIFQTWVNDFEAEKKFKHGLSATAGINHTWESGRVFEYGADQPERNRTAVVGAIKYQPARNWLTVVSARQEAIQGKFIPFVPSLSVEFHPTLHLNFYSNASRNYRVPTFNDLFWKGGGSVGNPNLKSETSWSQEVGVRYLKEKTNSLWRVRGSAFSNFVDNWILWSPGARGWSPDNIKQVWARGVESDIRLTAKLGTFTTEATAFYSYTLSTNRSVYAGSLTGELNKQLIFTPRHEASVTALVRRKTTSLVLTHNYTGKQFTDGDNSAFFALKSYQITNLWITQELTLRATLLRCQFEVNNIFNVDYQARPGYPMPGRNYKLSLFFQFNQLNKHEN